MRGTVLNQTFIINEESVGQREVCFYLFIRKKKLEKSFSKMAFNYLLVFPMITIDLSQGTWNFKCLVLQIWVQLSSACIFVQESYYSFLEHRELSSGMEILHLILLIVCKWR